MLTKYKPRYTQSQAARELNVTRQFLHQLITGKRTVPKRLSKKYARVILKLEKEYAK